MPETVAQVKAWEVWFTHSHCSADACHEEERAPDHGATYFETWAEAAEAIETRLRGRRHDCRLDAIVDLVTMSRAEWDAMVETT